MGEYSGYLSPGGGSPKPVYHVTAMTYRHDPILPVIAAGEPVEENHTCWGLVVSAQLLWELRKQGFPVSMCFCPLASAGHWLVITLDRSYRGLYGREAIARELGRWLFSSRCGWFIPKVILLDDDVDATNLEEVVWAFATRTHPEQDQILFPEQDVLPLVAFLSPEERKQARGMKAVYNGLARRTGGRGNRTPQFVSAPLAPRDPGAGRTELAAVWLRRAVRRSLP